MKCPFCGAYSLTYEPRRNLFVCHVYNATTYAEAMPT